MENTYATGTNMDYALTQEKIASIAIKRLMKKKSTCIMYHKQGAEAIHRIEQTRLQHLREDEKYGTAENFTKKEHVKAENHMENHVPRDLIEQKKTLRNLLKQILMLYQCQKYCRKRNQDQKQRQNQNQNHKTGQVFRPDVTRTRSSQRTIMEHCVKAASLQLSI